MFQLVIKRFRQGEYIIDVEYEWDYQNKFYTTNFWITKERYGTKIYCIGEIGTMKDSAIICTIDSCIEDWIDEYEFQIKRTEDAINEYLKKERNK